ncbi:hypothetical protein ACEPAF_8175 [Sanghuangporus sanghuang]
MGGLKMLMIGTRLIRLGSSRLMHSSFLIIASRKEFASSSAVEPYKANLLATTLAVPATFIAWRLTGSFLDKFFTRKFTVLNDIDNLGPKHARPEGKRISGTAVVCGGSIAGLWSALIASDHFENVLIIEPETWVLTEEGMSNTYDEKGIYIKNSREHVRSRVAQYNAHHAFHPIALEALSKYFPNVGDEFIKANAIIADYDLNCHAHGRHFMAAPSQEDTGENRRKCFFASRELYERILRRLVLNYSDRIRAQVGTVTGLNTVSGDPMTISSVSVRLPDGNTEETPATLVIDCTGASQAGLKWLRRIATDPVNSNSLQLHAPSNAISWDDLRLSYNTHQKYIRFRWPVPPEARDRLPIPGGYNNVPWMYTYFPIPGKEQKLFMFSRVEGERIETSFGGWGEPPAPSDISEIKSWFRGLEKDHQKVPDWIYPFFDVLMEQSDKVEVSTGKYPPPSWILYEKAPYIPHNFIATGDAVQRPNPTYGQGCSKATIGAVTLDSMLKSPPISDATKIPRNFGRDFFMKHADKIRGVWQGTKPTDYQFSTTVPCKGEKLSDEWLMGSFGKTLMEMAGLDKEADSVLYKVRFFMAPHTALLTPHMLSKMLLFHIRKTLGLIQS